jgi:NAD(P)-dependent dehydrogenase (short-subunit alcohol dehydrogenase family)
MHARLDAWRGVHQAGDLLGDLSSIEATRRVAAPVNALGRPDAVIHNAAVHRLPPRAALGRIRPDPGRDVNQG